MRNNPTGFHICHALFDIFYNLKFAGDKRLNGFASEEGTCTFRCARKPT